jgi:uncharacterized HAD superfamily protein
MVVLCDIDGTINDFWVRYQNNILSGKYFTEESVMSDSPLPFSVEVNHFLHEHFELYFLTARGWDANLTITRKWLDKHAFKYQNVFAVSCLKDKFEWVKYKRCDILIDDFRTGQERGLEKTTFHQEIVSEIESLGVVTIVCDQNWLEIKERLSKYL